MHAVLPSTLRAHFPTEAAAMLEQDATVEGRLTVYHVDAIAPATSRFLYFLDTAKGRLPVHFAKAPPELRSGAKLRIEGLLIDGAMLAESGTTSVTNLDTAKAAVLPNTLGAQKTLMIYVNFIDNATQPFTIATARSMFDTMSSYWYEVSYQQTWLTGDVAGWFTVPVSSATCDYASLATYAKQAAASAGYVLANYSHYVYVFPAWSACAWAGLGQIGGTPTEAWINPQAGLLASSFAHELGHNLGLYHAHSLSCPGGVPIAASGCATSEYGDGFDTMAAPQQSPHYNAFMKELLGWLGAGVSPPIVTAAAQSGSATYTIAPLEIGGTSVPRALRVPRIASCGSAADYFYVESRQAVGFDSYIAGLTTVPYGASISPATNLQTGVLVHDAIPGGVDVTGSLNSSKLLDMAGSSTGWAGPALVAGAAFTDPVSGVTITPLSVGSTSSAISVTYPPSSCVHAVPSVAIAPAGTQYTSAGTTTTYTVNVTNNDSCGCAASAFSIGAAPPAGWSASNPSTAGVAPGSTVSALLSIASPASAAPAFYTIPIDAESTSAANLIASTNGTIAITSPQVPPSVVLSPTGTRSATPGTTLTYTSTVTNNGTSPTSFTVTAAVPSGWSASSSQTGSVASGASTSVSVSITSSGTASLATYVVPVSAVDTSSSLAGSANASISIVAPSLGITVTSSQPSYARPTKRNQIVNASITTSVKSNGAPDVGAAVSVRVSAPNGTVTTLSAKTGSNGTAKVSYPIKSKSVTGTYAVTASATFGSANGTATTSFTVN